LRISLFSKTTQVKEFMKQQVFHETKNVSFPRWKQWKQLPSLLSKTEQRILQTAFILAFISLFILVGGYLFTHGSPSPVFGGTYTEGLIGAPQLINPLYAISDVDQDLSKLIYTGLFRWDPENGIIPDIALSYTVSEDKKNYYIDLRSDVFWHHGSQVQAKDIILTFKLLQDPAYQSPFFSRYQGIKVEEINPYQIVFTLEKPSNNFLSLLTIGLLPADLWQSIPAQNAVLTSLNREPIGNGPFKFEKLEMDKRGVVRSYELSAYQEFHRGSPLIKQIHFKFYPNEKTAEEAVKNKHIQGLGFVSPEFVSLFEKEGMKFYYPQTSRFTTLFFNTQKHPALQNKEIRKWLARSIKSQSLIPPDQSPIMMPIFYPFFPEITEKIEISSIVSNSEDQNLATLLEAAKIQSPLALTLVTVDEPEFRFMAETLKQQWGNLGISLTIQFAPPASFEDDILRTRTYDLLLVNIEMGKDGAPFIFWHSSQIAYPGLNFSQWKNEDIDPLLQQWEETQDKTQQTSLAQSMETILEEEVPAIFLVRFTYPYTITKRIKNVFLPQIHIPSDRFSRIETWYMNTQKKINLF